ncbi:hypothetical protein NLL32_07235 [Corynebacterium propinquum]|uniref:hypothetical protein n=1 Tax=Corynebacterium propinquum TaxID=43769 RepID=UPI001642B921|nr:hypothetical protein [Corynebacterium propinquum]WKS48544.1 hypothetical protein NLL32_07235 [Corynebacterium propinquum]
MKNFLIDAHEVVSDAKQAAVFTGAHAARNTPSLTPGTAPRGNTKGNRDAKRR